MQIGADYANIGRYCGNWTGYNATVPLGEGRLVLSGAIAHNLFTSPPLPPGYSNGMDVNSATEDITAGGECLDNLKLAVHVIGESSSSLCNLMLIICKPNIEP